MFSANLFHRRSFTVAHLILTCILLFIVALAMTNGITRHSQAARLHQQLTFDDGVVSLHSIDADYGLPTQTCTYTITPASQVFNAGSGSGNVAVTTGSGCAWAASSNAAWITINSGSSGSGNGAVNFSVAANTGSGSRGGTLTIAGRTFTVVQAGAGGNCTNMPIIPAQTINGTLIASDCRAISRNGATLADRYAFTAVAGQQVNIVLRSSAFDAFLGLLDSNGVVVTTNDDCEGRNSCINTTLTTPGTYIIEATALNAGSMGDYVLTYNATIPNCNFAIAPTSQMFPGAGGTGTVNVTAPSSCSWATASNASWLTITEGSSGAGNGMISFSVALNTTSSSRTGTLAVAGQLFMVTQSACLSISPASQSFGPGGGTGSVTVAGLSGCGWTAISGVPWLMITSGNTGAGNGTVNFSVAANTDANGRGGTLTIGGNAFTVVQPGADGSCSVTSIIPAQTINGALDINDCRAVSRDGQTLADRYSFIGVVGQQIEISHNSLVFDTFLGLLDPNGVVIATDDDGGDGINSRIALTLTVSGTYIIEATTRNAGNSGDYSLTYKNVALPNCNFVIAPASQTVPGNGGAGTVNVTAPSGCSWAAASNAPSWITITTGNSGTGNGVVSFLVALNDTNSSRTGTLAIAGQLFTVMQPAQPACFSIAPANQTFNPDGGTGSVTVTGLGGCSWAAVSNASWITITLGSSGTGSGTVNYSVTANTSATSRTGTLTIAGQTFTVTQYGTTPILSNLSLNSATAGGTNFTLTIHGDNFRTDSIVRWNGSNRTTTFAGLTQLKAAITAADIASTGTASITVFNPTLGGGTSNTLSFSITSSVNDDRLLTSGESRTGSLSATPSGSCTVFLIPQYLINVPSGATDLRVEVSSSRNVNLYVRYANRVTIDFSSGNIIADYKAESSSGNETISFTPQPGTYYIALGNCSTGTANFTLTATVTAPCHTVSSISPTIGTVGSTVTIVGANFTGVTAVRFANNTSANFTINSDTQITATVPSGAVSGPITIIRPNCPDIQSGAFTVQPSQRPTLVQIAPSSGVVSGAGFTLTLTGTNFISGSVVRWNGNSRATTFVSATQITAAIPASDIATIGTANVTVFNPMPGGGESDALTFAINNPLPTLASLSPSDIIEGGVAFTLTVTGANFIRGTVVRWNGNSRQTSLVSSTQLIASIPARDIAAAGTATITTFTPNGGESNALTFIINPNPRVLRVVPITATVGNPVSVAIELAAQGNENGVSFSLMFDPALLSSPQAALGSGAGGAALTVNANQAAQGRLGVIVSQPPGQVFAAGTKQILVVSFNVAAVTTATSTTVGFGDQPAAREVTDASANVLTASYTPGTVSITPNASLTLSPSSLASGTIGRAYSQTITASGGAAPYVFAVTAGVLPPGLLLATGGTLSGTPTQAGVFPVTISATDANNRSGSASYTLIINSNLQFYALTRPIRLLDTRPADQRPGPAFDTPGAKLRGGINGGTPRTQLARVAFDGVTIPTEAQAVVGTATALNYPAAGEYAGTGNVTFYPSAANRPEVSNLNYAANQTVGNAFTVGLSDAGAFDIFVYSDVHLVIDIVGYYAPPGAGSPVGLYYHPLPQPVRLLETRSDPIYAGTACNMPGAPLLAGSVRTQPARGTCTVQGASITIPDNAQAIIGNLTAVNAAQGLGAAAVYSSDLGATPVINSLSYDSSQAVATAFATRLGGDGAFKLHVSSTTDFLVDIVGYFSPDATDANGAGLLYTQLAQPVRLLDTRPDFPACDTPRQPLADGVGGVRLQPVRLCNGASIIPETALAVVGNATVVNFVSAGTGNVSLYPGNTAKPEVSTLNYGANQVIPNAFTVGLGSAGAFNIFAFSRIDFLVDLTGYYAP